MATILTSGKAVDIYTYVEDYIVKCILSNRFSNASVFINLMKNDLLTKSGLFGARMEIDTVVIGDDKQMEISFYFPNAVLYIRTLFYKDPDVLFIHNTDLVYITDTSGVVKQDLLKYIKNYQP